MQLHPKETTVLQGISFDTQRLVEGDEHEGGRFVSPHEIGTCIHPLVRRVVARAEEGKATYEEDEISLFHDGSAGPACAFRIRRIC